MLLLCWIVADFIDEATHSSYQLSPPGFATSAGGVLIGRS